MDPFTCHQGRIAVYSDDHVDTDRIIPARYLTRVTRSGYGDLLFADVRNPEFPLDRPEAQGASILVVGTNFGCGSSREHAVWAILQAGFRAVIARRDADSAAYSDIFRQNAANCGLLLLELPTDEHTKVAQLGSGAEVTIDLPAQEIRTADATHGFEINAVTKDALIKGLDLIGTTMEHEADITAFEMRSVAFTPPRAS